MQHLPKISIVMCTFNGDKYLIEQIESLINQTYKNLEIIIVDDASTDNTRNILLTYQRHLNIKIVLRDKNVGYIQNFISGAMMATGSFITFSDQDDIWLPYKVEKLYDTIGNHLLVYSNSKLIDENGNDLHKELSQLRKMGNVYDLRGFIISNVVWGHSIMIKQALLNDALPIPEKIPHDIWLGVIATSLTGVAYVEEPLTLYRRHKQTITQTITTKGAGSRKRDIRQQDYIRELRWIELLKDNSPQETKMFFNQLYTLYLRKANKHFVWQLFFFLFKNQAHVFKFLRKNSLSRLIEIRKMSRGELPL